jgi:SAM-dependent methyltransferase
MFSKTAAWYDALYSYKNYQQESDQIIERIKSELPDAKTILNAGCGTAEHDRYLSQFYSVDGLDINPDFIQIAARKNPQGKYFCADMVDFALLKRYDVVLCLFGSIGYVKTLTFMVRTLERFKRHLNPGGIIMVEPWLTPETWHPEGKVYMSTGETEDGKICRMSVSKKQGTLSVLNFHYLLGTSEGIEYFTERHELGLFSVEEMCKAFDQAGLSAIYDKAGWTGRGLYVAREE